MQYHMFGADRPQISLNDNEASYIQALARSIDLDIKNLPKPAAYTIDRANILKSKVVIWDDIVGRYDLSAATKAGQGYLEDAIRISNAFKSDLEKILAWTPAGDSGAGKPPAFTWGPGGKYAKPFALAPVAPKEGFNFAAGRLSPSTAVLTQLTAAKLTPKSLTLELVDTPSTTQATDVRMAIARQESSAVVMKPQGWSRDPVTGQEKVSGGVPVVALVAAAVAAFFILK